MLQRRTLVWLSWLAGLMMLMSSPSGDMRELELCSSSLSWFTCASSSICGAVSLGHCFPVQAVSTSVDTVPLLSTGEGSTVAG